MTTFTLTQTNIDNMVNSIINSPDPLTPDSLFNVLLPSQDVALKSAIDSTMLALDKQFGNGDGVLGIEDFRLLITAIKSNHMVGCSFCVVLCMHMYSVYKAAIASPALSKTDLMFSVLLYIVLVSVLKTHQTHNFIVQNKELITELANTIYSAYYYFIVTENGLAKIENGMKSCWAKIWARHTIATNTSAVKVQLKKNISQ